MERIKIGIVDDNRANRTLLTERITGEGSLEVVCVAMNGQQFLDKMLLLPQGQLPFVVLMDIEMPVLDGIETVRQGSVLFPAMKYIMLTVFDDDDKIFEAIKAGASGYLLKDEKVSIIIDAIHQVKQYGASPMSPRIARKALDMLSRATVSTTLYPNNNIFQLSDREREILKLLVDGLDYKHIAANIFISPHTVRNHISNIYNKLHVTSKAQAIKMATKNNLV